MYYLPQNVYAGALTKLDLAPLFSNGGTMAAMIAVSIDNAAGVNDFIAFLSTTGECVMFQGYDPSSASTWSEAGHFFMAPPLTVGRRTWQKIGSDALIMCADGITTLSSQLLTDRTQPDVARTKKIRKLFQQSVIANTYLSAGFPLQYAQLIFWPASGQLIAQLPGPTVGPTFQVVQSLLAPNGWSTWNNPSYSGDAWGASCWEVFGNDIYFGQSPVSGQGCVLKFASPPANGVIPKSLLTSFCNTRPPSASRESTY